MANAATSPVPDPAPNADVGSAPNTNVVADPVQNPVQNLFQK